MAQHYTRNTVSVSALCARCGKFTQHRIDDRRVGPCLDCIARPAEPRPGPAQGSQQLKMFGERQ